jgi:hypothetical protein
MMNSEGKLNTQEKDEDYSVSFTFGDLVGVYVDQVDGIIEFEKNGNKLGPI